MLTSSDFLKNVRDRANNDICITAVQTRVVYDAMVAELKEAFKNDGVYLAGLGKFQVQLRPERAGRNPRTGEIITVPAKYHLKFSIYPENKRMTNDKEIPE